jgi:integrase
MANLPVSKVTGTMIAAYRDQRLSAVKAGTVRRELALLRHCLEVARKEWGIPIYKNPFVGIKMPEPANSRDRRLEDRDVRLILHNLQKTKAWYLQPMIELALETGMRRGELLNLKWSNVNLTKRLATLPITKNGKCRKVPLTPRAIELLSALPQADDRAFPIGTSAFRQAWDRLMKRCGIDDLCFHDLRHEAISRFFEMGLSVPEVALISGHRDYRMLFRYTHIRPSDVVAKLNDRHRPTA